MKFIEGYDQVDQHAVAEEDQDDRQVLPVIECIIKLPVLHRGHHHLVDPRVKRRKPEYGDNRRVGQEEYEELAVVEAHTVVDPGAVVVHVEDAAVAC